MPVYNKTNKNQNGGFEQGEKKWRFKTKWRKIKMTVKNKTEKI